MFVLTTHDDALLVDMEKGFEVDLDHQEQIGKIHRVMYHGGYFYILANER